MRNSSRAAGLLVVLALAFGIAAMPGSEAIAGAKCPNRYFKKKPAVGIDPDKEDNAKSAYKDAVAAVAKQSENDCDNQECDEEESEKCRFEYTYKKTPKCKQVPKKNNRWECTGWVRPGCFCRDADESKGPI